MERGQKVVKAQVEVKEKVKEKAQKTQPQAARQRNSGPNAAAER